MLIRLVLENIFSFAGQKEFNTLPYGRLGTLDHHKYNFNGFEILKMSSLYGANGAGKSNLIKSLQLLKTLVVTGKIPYELIDSSFKLEANTEPRKQALAIEFIAENQAFLYGIELFQGIIQSEELYLSGLGNQQDSLLFERKTSERGITSIKFPPEFEADEKSQILKSILLEEFVKKNEPVLKLISNRDNQFLKDVKKAFLWFDETLEIVTPNSRASQLAHTLDIDPDFKNYAKQTMSSFDIGITTLESRKDHLKDFFGKDDDNQIENIKKEVENSPNKIIGLVPRIGKGNHLIIAKEGDNYWVKTLKIGHSGASGESILFELDEESDGTIRLLDFLPAFYDIITENKVFVIDEIERSIHPLLIKELVRKFSHDQLTKGQLLFTTHESNLLDQDLFRQDEIWFAEKDSSGATDLYSLSDFKEHKSIDIRKGYLNGRYGSIPFLGNLQDLNWHQNDINK